jgi:hypothetical protein
MKTFYTILLFLFTFAGKAQISDVTVDKKMSVTVSSGISFYSVLDNNISNEKYSGTLIPFNFILMSNITDRQFRDFYFSLQTGTIKNYKVDAHVNELTLGWDYGFKINKKKAYDIFLGPSPFLYFYDRQEEISSKTYFNSDLGLITLAGVFGIKSNKLNGFNYKIKGRLGLLSVGVSPGDGNKTKILTPLNGLQFNFSALVSYKLLNWADIAFEYSFQTYNITAWNKMYSLSDQLTLNLIFTF